MTSPYSENVSWPQSLMAIIIVFGLIYYASNDSSAPENKAAPQNISSCVNNGIAYFKEIGSYPTLTSPPNVGMPADIVARERCTRSNSAFPTASSAYPVPNKKYTSEQLNTMIKSGDYPELGAESSSESSRNSSFDDCINELKRIISVTKNNYPVTIISDTSEMFIVRLWKNDQATTLTCSEKELTKSIVIAPYL